MQEKVYVITSTDSHGTGATDECLREIQQAGVELIESSTGGYVGIEDIDVIHLETYSPEVEIPEILFAFPIVFINWDREGMLHMKEVHTKKFYLTFSVPSQPPNLYRRLEKAPYSGRFNLRF
jgi:hypothetical protein